MPQTWQNLTVSFFGAIFRILSVPIRVGVLEGDWAEILSGLAVGDVVVQGDAVQRIPDGTTLRVDGGSAEIAGDARGDAS